MIEVPVMPCCGQLVDACECTAAIAEVQSAPVLVDVDQEIKRRIRNRRGRTPKEWPDPFGEFAGPFGSIVDGYQLQVFGIWHRIDRADEIDLELLRSSSPWMWNIGADEAARFWRDSIGEMTVPR